MNQFFSIGLKVLTAAGVGIAVYLGIDKVVKNNSQPGTCDRKPQQPTRDHNNPNSNSNIQEVENTNHDVQPSSAEKVVSGLKVAQDVFSRAFSLCQNVSMAVENIVRIFGNSSSGNYGGYDYYNNNDPYYNRYQDKYKDPPGYRRLSPFIIEYVGGPVDSNQFNSMHRY